MEEDAGKSLHEAHSTYTGIDLNRAGTPLLEIVTTPCLFSANEAISYLKALHQLVRFLGICDGNMQEGSFRCDVNLSLKRVDDPALGTRTELKNLNSFRFIEKAIEHEQRRHQDILESGQRISQETRLYCPNTNTTQLLRKKENENDYRYFPDPDLLPIRITDDDLEHIKATLPPLPETIKRRLKDQDQLTPDDIDFLLASPAALAFYDDVNRQSKAPPTTIINWLKGTYTAALNEKGLSFEHPPVSSAHLACLLDRVTDNKIPIKLAKTIFAQLIIAPQSVDELIAASGYEPSDDNLIDEIIRSTVENNPQQAADYRAGKEKLLSFFVGLIMKQTKGQADPAQVNERLVKYLRGSCD